MKLKNLLKMLKIQSRLLQLMTCKDAINSDTNSEEEKLYLLNEIRRSSKDFKFDLEGTADQIFL